MRRISISALVLAAAPAAASGPAAWVAHDAAVKSACVRASGLLRATTSKPVLFSDAQGRTALLVRGGFPQRALKGRIGTYLCLYDRATKRAEAVEAPDLKLDPRAGSR